MKGRPQVIDIRHYQRQQEDLSWMDDGRCRGVKGDVFFPTSSDPRLAAMAKRICGECGVRRQCLEFALKYDEEGIWGGTTAPERERLRCRAM